MRINSEPCGCSERNHFLINPQFERIEVITLKLSKLEKYFYVDKIIYHSLDLALYNVSVVIDGKEYMVTDEKGQRLKSHNFVLLQKKLKNVKAELQVMRQLSAYDEMVGGPSKINNELEVPLGDNKLY